MNFEKIDMKNPVNRLRGGRLITMRGKWGQDWRLRLFIRATLRHPEQIPVRGDLDAAFTSGKNGEFIYWYDFPIGGGMFSTGIVRNGF
jgi:hypothetical protein